MLFRRSDPMRRYAAVAGQFYAGSRERLIRQIEGCYLSPLGPGSVPKPLPHGKREIKGAIVPHAGYVYSGPVAAHTYSAIAADGVPETIVILGPNHTGLGSGIAVTNETFVTPLGDVQVDAEIANAIAKDVIDMDATAHREEHSIEVQLPFIQHLKPDCKIVPVCMGIQDYSAAEKVGKIIKDAIKGKDAVVIASTDFSHYVRKDTAQRLDRLAIDCIIQRDPKKLHDVVMKNDISMCGYGPVMAMLFAAGGTDAKLLKYATSGDVSPMSEVVGYASIIVR